MLVIASMTAWAQQQFGLQQSAPKSFTPQEQELIDLSNQKWAWMSEKNADKLAELFHDNAMFVHMQVARDLLRYTDLPLTEVMQRCGYTSMPTFSRTVRRWWGVSPQHLRILARNSGDIGKYAL